MRDIPAGKVFGKLKVLKKVRSHDGWQYRCGCECGNSKTIVTAAKLESGRIKACANCRRKA